MASPQLDNGFVKIANELFNEFMRHDFSKRQRNILDLILRLSFGVNKKTAHIPKQSYFSAVGIDKSDIKKELKYLVNTRVIFWDEEDMIFSLNKDYDQWKISPSKKFDDDLFKQLIHINLSNSNVGKTPTNEVGKTPTNKNNEVGKTPTKIDKRVGKIQTFKLVKYQPFNAGTPTESKAEQVSKDSIKYNIKDSKEYNPDKISHWGDYQNVKLSDRQYDELVNNYGDDDADHFIERLSSFMYEKGARVKDHYATIEKWIKEDRGEQAPIKRTAPVVQDDEEAQKLRNEYLEAIPDEHKRFFS